MLRNAKDFAQQRFALQLCRLAAAPRHDGGFDPSLKCRDTLAEKPVFGSGELWKSWAKSPTTMGIQPTIIKSNRTKWVHNGFNWHKTTISSSSQLHNLDGLQRPHVATFHLTYGEIHWGSGSYRKMAELFSQIWLGNRSVPVDMPFDQAGIGYFLGFSLHWTSHCHREGFKLV